MVGDPRRHVDFIVEATRTLDVNPARVVWHYLKAVYEDCDRNKSHMARRLGLNRRSLQRRLDKKPPAERLGEGKAP